jgi:site-specific DNA-cytosine methylase
MEQAGFHTVSVVEKDSDAVRTIALNRPHLNESAVPREIEKVDVQNLLQEAGKILDIGRTLKPGEPPCQPFSTAGKRGSVGDPRGSLFMDFIRVVKEIQPRFFVMENVRGLLSAPIRHRSHNQRGENFPPLEPDEMRGSALKVVLAEMQGLGYDVVYNLSINLRPLSVRECARIQTFPDDWIFNGSISSKYKQIGNAVPVLLGKAIGDYIYSIIQEEKSKEKNISDEHKFLFTNIRNK